MKDADGCLIFSTKRRKIPGIPVSAPDGLTVLVEPPTVESALQMVVEGLLALESEVVERLRAQEGDIRGTLLEVTIGDEIVYPVKPNANQTTWHGRDAILARKVTRIDHSQLMRDRPVGATHSRES
jgi:hypothetical protein